MAIDEIKGPALNVLRKLVNGVKADANYFEHVSAGIASQLEKKGAILINPNIADPNGKGAKAAKPSPDGIAYIEGLDNTGGATEATTTAAPAGEGSGEAQASAPAKSAFSLDDDVPVFEPARRTTGQAKYPFAKMRPGQSFKLLDADAKDNDAMKVLRVAASQANSKFARVTGTKTLSNGDVRNVYERLFFVVPEHEDPKDPSTKVVGARCHRDRDPNKLTTDEAKAREVAAASAQTAPQTNDGFGG